MDALSHCHAPKRWSCTGSAADTGLAERGANDAGRPNASVQGLLQTGKVRRTSRGAFTSSDELLKPD